MQVYNTSMAEFLGANKTLFVVPVYQRNYDWLDANCRQLFRDIEKVIETGEEHFLGTVVFKTYSSHERSLVDGQQRTISSTLLLKALRDVTSDEELKREIDETYIYNTGRGITDHYEKVKLHLNRRDDAVYQIILDNAPEKYEELLSDRQKESRVYRNYLLFSELIRRFCAEKDDAGRIFDAFEKLIFIELEIQNENAQEVFESLNSTGLSLTNVDLLRNYLLMQFDYKRQTYLYDTFWAEIENNVTPSEMENFFVDYLICRRRSDSANVFGRNAHINKRTLYEVFRDYYKSLSGSDHYVALEGLLADMLECSKEYKKLIFPDDVNPFLLDDLSRKMYEIAVLNAPSMRSLLLYLLMKHAAGKINSSIFHECVLATSSFAMRTKICGHSSSAQFAGSVIMRIDCVKDDEGFADAFWKALFSGRGKLAFPSDDEFKTALREMPMYQALRSKGTKYFLYELETHSPFPKGLPAYNDASISIEHIMPQKLSHDWKKDLSAEDIVLFDSYIHRTGNLALVSANSEISNAAFDQKKIYYRETNFYFTRRLCDYGQWNTPAIDKRGNEMAEMALRIWSCPKKYQMQKRVVLSPLEGEYGLSDDLSRFTFAKPEMIIISGEEISVTGWHQMIVAVCDFLNRTDPDMLHMTVRPGKIGMTRYREDILALGYDLNMYTEISHGIYTRTAKSAYDTLVAVSRILESFDREAETSFFDTFRFKIRKKK